MAKSQYPVNGKYKKDFKVTSPYGYRMHPIRKEKIHHNGVDLWGAKEPLLLEVWHDGVVTVSTTNMASFGHYVVIKSNVNGKWITTLYAHMKSPSKLKKGQKVEAGTVVGIMGATGPVTGKHLHLEIGKGKTHPFIFGGDGSRYYDPMKFIAATLKREEAEAEAKQATAEASLPTPVPAEEEIPEAPLASLTEEESATLPAPVKKPVAKKKPAPKKTK